MTPQPMTTVSEIAVLMFRLFSMTLLDIFALNARQQRALVAAVVTSEVAAFHERQE